MVTSIPTLSLGEGEDVFSLNGGRINTGWSQRLKDFCEDSGSTQAKSSLSSPSIGSTKAPDEEQPFSVRQFQLDCLCISESIKEWSRTGFKLDNSKANSATAELQVDSRPSKTTYPDRTSCAGRSKRGGHKLDFQ